MKSKRPIARITFAGLVVLALTSCVQQMGKHGRMQPYEGTEALIKLSGRPPDGTVPQSGPGVSDTDIDTRADDGAYRAVGVQLPRATNFNLPRPFSKAMMAQGKILYEVNCLPCHGVRGAGDGMVVQRGFLAPPSYHIDRLVKAADQHFFDVISHGYGAMYSYAYRVKPAERWAITAYIRALQLSQNAPIDKLSPDEKNRLNEGVSL